MMNGLGGMMGGLGTLLVLSWISLLAVAIWAVARILPRVQTSNIVARRAKTPPSRP